MHTQKAVIETTIEGKTKKIKGFVNIYWNKLHLKPDLDSAFVPINVGDKILFNSKKQAPVLITNFETLPNGNYQVSYKEIKGEIKQ